MKKIFSLVVILFCGLNLAIGQITFTATADSATCNGKTDGSIEINITSTSGALDVRLYRSGGSSLPVKEELNTVSKKINFTNLGAATYTILICPANSSSGCASRSIIIYQPTKLSFLGNASDNYGITIMDGSCTSKAFMEVPIIGGTAPFTYTLTDQSNPSTPIIETSPNRVVKFEDLDEGIYTLTVNDKYGCGPIIAANLSVKSPPELTAQIVGEKDNLLCKGDNDGWIDVEATGGTFPYHYVLYKYVNGFPIMWSDNWFNGYFDQLGAGKYIFVVFDSNTSGESCSVEIPFTITEPATSVEITNTTHTDLSCKGGVNIGTIKVIAKGGTGDLTYTLTPGNLTNNTGEFSGLAVGIYTVTVTDENGCSDVTGQIEIKEPDKITFEYESTDPKCFGETTPTGTIKVKNPKGGTGTNYTYNLKGGSIDKSQSTPEFTGLPAGTYTVTVTDPNDCSSDPASVTLEAPTPIKVNKADRDSTAVTCFGKSDGSIGVTATGGKPGYIYQCGLVINTTGKFTSLPAGSQTVTITDANGCSITVIVTVNSPKQIYAGITLHTDVDCYGNNTGALTAKGKGGDGNYDYSWSNGKTDAAITGLIAGNYIVTVTDGNGCEADTTVTIKQPASKLAFVDITKIHVTCYNGNNGQATAIVKGGTPYYEYVWNPTPGDANTKTSATARDLSAGNYTVTITDAKGCTKDSTITIEQPVAIVATATAGKSPLQCFGETTTITVTPTSPTTNITDYQYQLNGGDWQPGNVFENVTAGDYTVYIRYRSTAGSCPYAGTATVSIKGDPEDITFDLEVSGNKCADERKGTITVKNVQPAAQGKYIYQLQPALGTQVDNSFTELPKGNYTVTVIDDPTGCTKSKSVTITDPAAIVPGTPKVTHQTCPGVADGKIEMNASGGTGTLSYYIDPDKNGQNPRTDGIFSNLEAGTYTVDIVDANSCKVTTSSISVDAVKSIDFRANADKAKLTCKNDITDIHITLRDSEPGYTVEYSLDNINGPWQTELIFEDVAAGNHTVYARYQGKNCAPVPFSVPITEPASKLTLSPNGVPISPKCHDLDNGEASVIASGGWGGYTYWWENSQGVKISDAATAINLTGGTYTAYVKDSEGCIELLVVIVEPVDPITIDQPIATTGVSCFGKSDGSATIVPHGGNAGSYTYAWDNGTAGSVNPNNSLAAGNHSVVVYDSKSCASQTFNFTIADRPELTISFTNKKDASCDDAKDGEVTATVSPEGGNYTYAWNTVPPQYAATATGLGKGSYTVTVAYAESPGCTFTNVVTIGAPSPITGFEINPPVSTTTLCAGETTVITVTAQGSQQLAYRVDGGVWQTSNTFEIGAGNHTVSVGYWISATEANCVQTKNYNIPGRQVITLTAKADDLLLPCDQTSTKIIITASGENGLSLEYRVDPNAQWQSGKEFTVGAGTYTPCVRYVTQPNCPQCEAPIVIKRDIDIEITNVVITGDMNCSDSKAAIEITATGNSGTLEYGLKHGSQTDWQSGNKFENLPAGSYEILVRYQGGSCAQSGGIKTITAPKAINLQPTVIGKKTLDCAGQTTTITVSASGETGRVIEYSIDNGTTWYDAGTMISDVSAGTYKVIARYKAPAPACLVDGETFTITAPKAIDIKNVMAKTQLDCFDETTQITIDAEGQDGYTLEYSINDGVDGSWSPNPNFTNIGKGNYNVVVRYKAPAAACPVNWKNNPVSIDAPDEIIINSATADSYLLDCSGPNSTTTIRVDATGNKTMEYTLTDGTNTKTSNDGVFANVPVGTYTVCVTYTGTTCQKCITLQPILSNSDIKSVTASTLKSKLNCGDTQGTTLQVIVDPAILTLGSYQYSVNGGAWVDDLSTVKITAGGTYSVKVRNTDDPSCEQTSNPVTILQPDPIAILSVTKDEPACYNPVDKTDVIVLADGSDAMIFTLTPDGGGTAISNSNGRFADVPNGSYTLTVIYQDAAFNACSVTHSDKITVNNPALIMITVTVDHTELKCADATTTLTVRATSNRELEFSLDGTNWFDNNGTGEYAFTVGAGTYTAKVRYKTTSPAKCMVEATGSQIKTVTAWKPIELIVVPDKTTLECDETSVNVTVTVSGESGKLIELNTGGTWISATPGVNTFALGAGPYTISARYHDSPTCVVSESLTINQNIDIDIDKVDVTPSKDLTCAGEKATITITARGNNAKTLVYTIDGGASWVSSNVFADLNAGTYKIGVKYLNENCPRWYDQQIVITAPDEIKIKSVTINGIATDHADLACNGDRATINVSATGNKALEYSISNNSWQQNGTFNDVPGGSYTVKVRYVGGTCEVFYPATITIFEPAAITITGIDYKPVLDCADSKTDITINATGEQKAGYELQYSINGGANWQSFNVFPNMSAGTYQPRVRYVNHTSCTAAQLPDFTITAPLPILITRAEPEISPLACDGSTTKIIVETNNTGRTLEYSLDNTNWYTLTNLPEVGAGAFTVYVRYAAPNAACVAQKSGSVLSNSTIQGVTLTPDKLSYTCNETAVLTVGVNNFDTNKTLQYRINGGSWQTGNTFGISMSGTYVAEVSYVGEETCIQSSAPLSLILPTPITIIKVEADYGKTALDCYNDKTNITVYVDAELGLPLAYTLIKNGTPLLPQANNVFNVGAGVYEVKVSYAGGNCETKYNQTITITEPKPIEIDQVLSSGNIQCEGDKATLSVMIKSSDESRIFEYSINGTTWQPANQFQVDPDTYDNIAVRYQSPAPGCEVKYNNNPLITIAAPDVITIESVVANKLVVDCDDPSDKAVISVTATSSNPARTLEYSFDGGAWSNVPTKEVTSGSHTVQVRFADAPNCPKPHPDAIIIQGNAGIQFSNVAVETPITCKDGKGVITATIVSTASNLKVSIDGGLHWIDVISGIAHSFRDTTAGTYTIQAMSADRPGCIVVSTPVQLTEPETIVASEISKTDATGCDTGHETPGTSIIGVTGGTAPYKYQLDGEITTWTGFTGNTITIPGLKSGKHTIRITDTNNCKSSEVTVNINNPDIIVFDANPANIRCFGEANGQLTIRVTQGHAPFTVRVTAPQTFDSQNRPLSPAFDQTYTINNYSDAVVISNLYANNYMIKVTDAKLCDSSKEVVIKQPHGPLIADYQGINICPDQQYGAIYPQTFGGWPDYVSYWYKEQIAGTDDYKPMFPDINGNARPGKVPDDLNEIEAGKYAIVVVDQAMCSDTSFVEIINLANMKVDGYREHGVICKNANSGSIKIVNPQGGSGGYYEYRVRYQGSNSVVPGFEFKQWENDSIAGLPQGDFYVEMRDHKGEGCPALRIPASPGYITIGTESGLIIEKISVNDAQCYKDEASIAGIRVKGSDNLLEYRLGYPGGAISPWQNSSVFEHLNGGTYTVYVQEREGGDGCASQKDTTITVPAQILITTSITEPKCDDVNPTKGTIDITITGGTGEPAVTYNGTALANGTAGYPATNEWKFALDIVKGGKAVIVVTDKNKCPASDTIDVPYTPGLKYVQQDVQKNKCPDDKNGVITVRAESVSSYVPGQLTYELYVGEITEGVPTRIVKGDITEAAVFSGLANGTYTISVYDDKNPQACFTDDWIVMMDNTNKITLTDSTVVNNDCNGKYTGRIIFTINGEASITEYKYSINGSLPVVVEATNGVADVLIQNLGEGVYTVSIQYGDCAQDVTFTVRNRYEVLPSLTPVAVTGCYGGNNGAINIQMIDRLGAPYQYWYNGLANGTFNKFVPTNSDKTTISGLTSGEYKVVIKNVDACVSDTVTSTVPDAPRLQIGYTETAPISCKGEYGTVEITVAGGSGNYTPSVVPQEEGGYPEYAGAPTLTGFTLSHVTGGLYRIAVIDNTTGCKDTLDININAPRVVAIEASHVDVTCATKEDETTPLTVQVTRPASGTFIYTINGSTTGAITNLTQTWNVYAGNYYITVAEQGSNCLADTTIIVAIPEPLTINQKVTPVDHSKCEYTADVVLTITGGTMPYIVTFNNQLITDYTITGLTDGNYPVEVVDAKGCRKTGVVTVSLPKSIDVTATVRDVNCNQAGNGSIVLNPTTYTYNWADGHTGNALYDLNAGKYAVKISNGSCSIDSVFEVKASYYIEVGITADGITDDTHLFCPGEQLVLNGVVNINGSPLTSSTPDAFANWILPNGETREFLSNNPLLTNASTGDIRLVASSGNCSSTGTFEMETKDIPTVVFATDTIYIPKDEVYVLTMDASSDYTSYNWTSIPAGHTDGLPAPPASVTLPSPDQPYSLVLTLVGANACPASDTIFVSRSMDFFIPNVFTPNGDGNHDTWMFRNIEQYTDYYTIEVFVVNRGGFQVYSGKGYNNSSVVWDGRRNGNDVPIGTYYYVVKLVPKSTTGSSETHTFTGSVTITR